MSSVSRIATAPSSAARALREVGKRHPQWPQQQEHRPHAHLLLSRRLTCCPMMSFSPGRFQEPSRTAQSARAGPARCNGCAARASLTQSMSRMSTPSLSRLCSTFCRSTATPPSTPGWPARAVDRVQGRIKQRKLTWRITRTLGGANPSYQVTVRLPPPQSG